MRFNIFEEPFNLSLALKVIGQRRIVWQLNFNTPTHTHPPANQWGVYKIYAYALCVILNGDISELT